AGRLVSIGLDGGGSVSFGLVAASGVAPVVDDAVVTYPGVRPDADLRFMASPSGVKEEIVLHSADAPTSWLFPLVVEGVTPSLEDDGAVVFTDDVGEVKGYIPPGYMVDSNVHPRRGGGEVSFGVS